MTRYVALLRGIAPVDPRMHNVRLREVGEALGLRNVGTVLSSGNLFFDVDDRQPSDLEAELEAAWPARLGFDSTTFVRSQEELAAMRDLGPFGDREHGKATYLLATFAKDPIPASVTGSPAPLGPGFEVLSAEGRELFTVSDTTAPRTRDATGWLERELGKTITSRTWQTVTRLLDRCEAGGSSQAT